MALLEQCKENLKQYDEQIYKSQETALKYIIEELESKILNTTKNGKSSYNMLLEQTITNPRDYSPNKIYMYVNNNIEFLSNVIISSKHLNDKLVEHFENSGLDVVCYEKDKTLFFTISLT